MLSKKKICTFFSSKRYCDYKLLPNEFVWPQELASFVFYLLITFFNQILFTKFSLLGTKRSQRHINEIISLFNSTYTRLASESVRHTMVFYCLFQRRITLTKTEKGLTIEIRKSECDTFAKSYIDCLTRNRCNAISYIRQT